MNNTFFRVEICTTFCLGCAVGAIRGLPRLGFRVSRRAPQARVRGCVLGLLSSDRLSLGLRPAKFLSNINRMIRVLAIFRNVRVFRKTLSLVKNNVYGLEFIYESV